MASSTGSCGLPHPDQPKLLCDQRGNHLLCSGVGADDEYVDWPNPAYVPPVRTRRSAVSATLTRVAALVPPASARFVREGFTAGLRASTASAENWTDAQKVLVDDAIETVARQHRGGGEFTSDAVWDQLGGSVPVTKGLTARLMMAKRRGLIDTTGKTEISERGGHHDHGQRLSVWYSMVPAT